MFKRRLSMLAALFGMIGALTVGAGQATASSTVYVYNLLPDWSTGVYSAYYPGSSDVTPAVSPGVTKSYLGRDAGIIKAGLVANDEGLFGFKPTVTIDSLTTSPLTYDVVNQYGTNPVWMTIEIDTGVADVRSDNVTFQMVPSAYGSAGYTTVNAGTATDWLQWTTYTSGVTTGSPRTLASIAADPVYHGLNVVRAFLRLGIGDSYGPGPNGTQAWVDKASIGGVTYDFVVPTLTGITVTPANPTITVGATQQFKATGTYSDATTADITGSVTWAPGTPAVATITAGGLATGVSAGSSTISATLGSVSGSTLLVSSAPTPTPTPFESVEAATGAPHPPVTPPPTSTGVGPASDEPASTIWLLPVALGLFFGSLMLLVNRQRRRVF